MDARLRRLDTDHPADGTRRGRRGEGRRLLRLAGIARLAMSAWPDEVVGNDQGRERPADFDPQQYRRRNVIERCVDWPGEARVVTTRFGKLAVPCLGSIKLARIC